MALICYVNHVFFHLCSPFKAVNIQVITIFIEINLLFVTRKNVRKEPFKLCNTNEIFSINKLHKFKKILKPLWCYLKNYIENTTEVRFIGKYLAPICYLNYPLCYVCLTFKVMNNQVITIFIAIKFSFVKTKWGTAYVE